MCCTRKMLQPETSQGTSHNRHPSTGGAMGQVHLEGVGADQETDMPVKTGADQRFGQPVMKGAGQGTATTTPHPPPIHHPVTIWPSAAEADHGAVVDSTTKMVVEEK